MSKKYPLWRLIAGVAVLGVFLTLLLIATLQDLSLSIALYRTDNLFDIFMESFGWYTAYLPAIYLFMMFIFHPENPHGKMLTAVCCLLVCAGLGGMFLYSYSTLSKRDFVSGIADVRTWLWLAGFAAFVFLMITAVRRIAPERLSRWRFCFTWGTLWLSAEIVLVYFLKLLWQRTRFDDMLASGSFADFTPWYLPLGNGGSSFPSAHTTNAVGILLLLFVCDAFAVSHKRRFLCYCLGWGYIALMAFSRICIGRHFLSDTIAGACIGALLIFAIRHTKSYQKSLETLHSCGERTPVEEE